MSIVPPTEGRENGPAPYYSDSTITLHHGDCLDVLRTLPDASVDAVVTDPPYGLEFMGKEWDGADGFRRSLNPNDAGRDNAFGRTSRTSPEYRTSAAKAGMSKPGIGERETGWPSHLGGLNPKCRNCEKWQRGANPCACDAPDFPNERLPRLHTFQEWCEAWARECLRVLKPGGHLLAFGGTRTWHRLACAVEDAGFEVRDSIAWMYGSGFPKSLDVSKAIDKRPGVMRHAEFARHLAEKREAAGLARADVSEAVVGTRTGACWNWEHHQFPEAKWWPALRDLLDLDDDTWGPVIAEAERTKTGERRSGDPVAWYAETARGDGIVDITAPATDAARTWQGWGTALKPAFEPIVVARKPLASPGVNVLARVESELRSRGIEGEVRWTTRPASDAARLDPQTSSSSTGARPTGGTSAAHADASETQSGAKPTGRSSATPTAHGAKPTASTSAPTPGARQQNSAPKSSPPMATPAPAVGSEHPTSSPSTTSTEAAPPTARRPGERSTTRSSASDSQTAIESFVGIATGLTGSWATVRIDRLADGTFVWPDGLPRNTAGGSTVAANVLAHGTGALNIDECRVGDGEGVVTFDRAERPGHEVYQGSLGTVTGVRPSGQGRWPANVILDESQAAALDEQSGELTSGANPTRRGSDKFRDAYGEFAGQEECVAHRGADSGGASRFFYVAKADSSERVRVDGVAHPTVKPLALMRWLVRLVTPPGGTVLEPFAGSGTTAEACLLEGFKCIAIEREADYLPLIRQRIARRRDPVEAVKNAGEDGGLFDLLGEETA